MPLLAQFATLVKSNNCLVKYILKEYGKRSYLKLN